MKYSTILAFAALALAGCGTTKSRAIDASGMYMSETGQLAIGRVHVDAIPEGQESAVIHYKEDTALLSPSTKTHDVDVVLTGTNSVGNASQIVTALCDAFVSVSSRPSSPSRPNLTPLTPLASLTPSPSPSTASPSSPASPSCPTCTDTDDD